MEIKADYSTILFSNLVFAINNHPHYFPLEETIIEVSPDDFQTLLAMRARIMPPINPESDKITFRGIPIESNENIQPGTFRLARVLRINEEIFE